MGELKRCERTCKTTRLIKALQYLPLQTMGSFEEPFWQNSAPPVGKTGSRHRVHGSTHPTDEKKGRCMSHEGPCGHWLWKELFSSTGPVTVLTECRMARRTGACLQKVQPRSLFRL